MFKVSIIIPIYNAEKYLKNLLESIKEQTIGFKNIQVIMVNDCSTDNSQKIINEYVKENINMSSIELETNNGVAGKARNLGLKQAEGKYIMFADADDFLMKNSVEILYNEIENKKADFIVANYINADEDGKVWEKPIFNKEKYKNMEMKITDYNKSFFLLNGSSCNKIYNKKFIEKNSIKFLEGVPAEDAYFVNSCFIKAEKVYYISDVVYCYRQRNKKTKKTETSVSFSRNRKYFSGINTAYRKIYELFRDNNKIGFYRYTYAKNMSYLLYKFIDSNMINDKERKEILKEMKWFYELSNSLKVEACQKAQQMIVHKIEKEDYEEAINYCKIIQDIRRYVPEEVREDMSRPDANMYRRIAKYDNEYK